MADASNRQDVNLYHLSPVSITGTSPHRCGSCGSERRVREQAVPVVQAALPVPYKRVLVTTSM